MYLLLFRQFLRTRTCQLGLTLVLVLGIISILIGKQFLTNQEKIAVQVSEKQLDHIQRNIEFHSDDLGLLLYYLEFALVNEPSELAALSIGQKDLNPSVQSVTIRTLEGQKYDTDLVNPSKLLYGNLDLSFLLIYVLPLLVIAFTYNLLSEEEESGTWKMVSVMSKSSLNFLLAKLSVRLVFLLIVMALLYLIASWLLTIPWEVPFLVFILTSVIYLLFWFALSFWVISFRRSSNFNALTLLFVWLTLVVLLPSALNNLVTTRYPVPEALTAMIKQRDGYHQKWDTNKRETLEKFYASYPQFETYGYPPEEGFNWLWYYAMQYLGDKESLTESKAMRAKIIERERVSRRWSQFVPPMYTQLAFNDIAGTSLTNHMGFLQYTNDFHENTRLYFYPKIFSQLDAKEVDWTRFKPTYYQSVGESFDSVKGLGPLLLLVFILMGWAVLRMRR